MGCEGTTFENTFRGIAGDRENVFVDSVVGGAGKREVLL